MFKNKVRPIVEPPRTPREIYLLGTMARKNIDRALFYTMYMSACRVTEALHLKSGDIEDRGEYVLFHLVNLKNRNRKFKDVPVPWGLSIWEDKMLKVILEHQDNIVPGAKLFPFSRHVAYHRLYDNIFYQTRAWDPKKKEYTIIEKPFNPHLLRHSRLTHLVTLRGFGAHVPELKTLAGWSNLIPAEAYIHLATENIINAYQHHNKKVEQ